MDIKRAATQPHCIASHCSLHRIAGRFDGDKLFLVRAWQSGANDSASSYAHRWGRARTFSLNQGPENGWPGEMGPPTGPALGDPRYLHALFPLSLLPPPSRRPTQHAVTRAFLRGVKSGNPESVEHPHTSDWLELRSAPPRWTPLSVKSGPSCGQGAG